MGLWPINEGLIWENHRNLKGHLNMDFPARHVRNYRLVVHPLLRLGRMKWAGGHPVSFLAAVSDPISNSLVHTGVAKKRENRRPINRRFNDWKMMIKVPNYVCVYIVTNNHTITVNNDHQLPLPITILMACHILKPCLSISFISSP